MGVEGARILLLTLTLGQSQAGSEDNTVFDINNETYWAGVPCG